MLRIETLAWAAALAAEAPLAVMLTKCVACLSGSVGLSEILTIEAELHTFLAGADDAREAIADFGAKRTPTYSGR